MPIDKNYQKFRTVGGKVVVAVIEVEVVPTAASKNNASGVLTRDDDGNPTTITITIGGVEYIQTLVWTDNLLTSWSAWSEV